MKKLFKILILSMPIIAISCQRGSTATQRSETTISQTQEAVVNPPKDTHNYVPGQMQQDFFQPISYSNEEIESFVRKCFMLGKHEEAVPYTNRFEDFRSHIPYYFEDPDLPPTERAEMKKRWTNVFEEEAWEFLRPYFHCSEEDGETSYTLSSQKKDTYFYETIVEITNERLETCQKKVRLVQIDGDLYFDIIYAL